MTAEPLTAEPILGSDVNMGTSRRKAVAHDPATLPRSPLLRLLVHSRLRRFASATLFLVLGALLGTAWTHHTLNPPLLVINRQTLSQRDFDRRCELAVGIQVLPQMIAETLQLQFADQQGVLPTDTQVEERYAQLAHQPDFERRLAASHQSPEDLKQSLRVSLSQESIFGKGLDVTDEEIRAFYHHNSDPANPQARYYHPETVQIAAIITDHAPDLQSAVHALASGASFASVAQQYSKDRSREHAGLLPAIQRGRLDGKRYPGLEQVVLGMHPGQQVDTLKVGAVWWLIRCVSHSALSIQPFESVASECREGALLQKGIATQGPQMQQAFAVFKQQAQIFSVNPEYQDLVTGRKP